MCIRDSIEVVQLTGKDPYRADDESRIVKVTLEAAEQVYGMKPSVFRSAAGTTAMGTFCGPTGIPAVSFGAGNAESNAHAPNENVYVEDFIQCIKMTATVMYLFGQGA